jgi:hypothetical protein
MSEPGILSRKVDELQGWQRLEADLDRKASAELSSRGTLALQDTMDAHVRSEFERLKECLAKIK